MLSRYDEAAQVYAHMVDLISHANGAYTAEEKNNRGIFLERLGSIYHEQNKTDLAIATYQKMIDMGGDSALRGYQGQVDVYRDAKKFDKASEVARKAVDANPKNNDLKLILADQLVDQGKADEAIALAKGLLNNTDKDRAVWLEIAQSIPACIAGRTPKRLSIKPAPSPPSRRIASISSSCAAPSPSARSASTKPKTLFPPGPRHRPLQRHGPQLPRLHARRQGPQTARSRQAHPQGSRAGANERRLILTRSAGPTSSSASTSSPKKISAGRRPRPDRTPPSTSTSAILYEKTGRIRLAAAQWQLSLTQYAQSAAADVEPADVAKLQHKLETARVKLAKEESISGSSKPE